MCKPRPEALVASRFGEGPTGAKAQRAQHVLRLRIPLCLPAFQIFFPVCLLIVLIVIVYSSFKFVCVTSQSRKPIEVQSIK